MCIFCQVFEVLYDVEADVALNPARWREYDAIRLGGASSDRAAKRDKNKYRRKAKKRAAGGAA